MLGFRSRKLIPRANENHLSRFYCNTGSLAAGRRDGGSADFVDLFAVIAGSFGVVPENNATAQSTAREAPSAR